MAKLGLNLTVAWALRDIDTFLFVVHNMLLNLADHCALRIPQIPVRPSVRPSVSIAIYTREPR